MTTTIVTGLAFGDEGKGATVDYLAQEARDRTPIVIRHNGACQAAHNVVYRTDSNFLFLHHTFAQFGSGTLSGARTYLSKYMLINPVNMLFEAEVLAKAGQTNLWSRLYVDPRCPIITPFHRAANRLREMGRGQQRHGSTGQGVGECMDDMLTNPTEVLRARDLGSRLQLRAKLQETRARILERIKDVPPPTLSIGAEDDEMAWFSHPLDDLIDDYANWYSSIQLVDENWLAGQMHASDLIFEGAQGVLLDEDYGFAPHVTWSKTTDANAWEILDTIGYDGEVQNLGLIRSYMTRHGAGPFPTEINYDTGGKSDPLHEPHNGTGTYQGEWRVGYLDLGLISYAIDCMSRPLTGLVINHMDRVTVSHQVAMPQGPWKRISCYSPDYEPVPVEGFAERIAEALNVPLWMTADGPTAQQRQRRHHPMAATTP